MTDRDPLEIIAIAAERGSYKDPRDPKGTKGAGILWSDIAHALGLVPDKFGADLALMIGTRSWKKAALCRDWLTHCVIQECNRKGREPDLVKVAASVDEAISNAITGERSSPYRNAYYLLAMGELMHRANSAASAAIRRVYRWNVKAA